MIQKTIVRSWNIIREHRVVFMIGTLLPSIIGIFLAETVMVIQFNTLQPILGGITFITVEALGACLIDFPMSVLAGFIIAGKTGTSSLENGALAGASFLTVFILLVACAGGILHRFAGFVDVFGLGDAALFAAQIAWEQFGYRFAVIMFMFLVADYLLCMLGGILGFMIIRLIHYPATEES